MSTDRQTRTAALHGEALLAAQDPAIEAIARQPLGRTRHHHRNRRRDGRLLFANPEMCFGHELIAAGLLLTGPIDRDELERWLRVG